MKHDARSYAGHRIRPLLEAIRILNEKLQSPAELDKALARIQGAVGEAAEAD